MPAAPLPANEIERIFALRRYGVLDSPKEPAFDRLTRLASQIFQMPIAVVSLVAEDRQWFKSCIGLGDAQETSRDVAFCAYGVLQEEILEVLDPVTDPRFCDNPHVTGEPHIRYYAGAPLLTPRGYAIGTFCLVDSEYRPPLTPQQREMLTTLAASVVDELELRLSRIDAEIALQAARGVEEMTRQQLDHLAHELKSPLTAILGYSQLTRTMTSMPETVEQYATHIHAAGKHLLQLITVALSTSRSSAEVITLKLPTLLRDVQFLTEPMAANRNMRVELEVDDELSLRVDQLRLKQVLLNYVTNALKYGNENTVVEVRAAREPVGRALRISVSDRGPGIPEAERERIFGDGFRLNGSALKAEGQGKGLAIVRLLASTLGGSVGVESEPGTGSTFWIRLPL